MSGSPNSRTVRILPSASTATMVASLATASGAADMALLMTRRLRFSHEPRVMSVRAARVAASARLRSPWLKIMAIASWQAQQVDGNGVAALQSRPLPGLPFLFFLISPVDFLYATGSAGKASGEMATKSSSERFVQSKASRAAQ